ncbi:hypothetical protein VZT92_014776 [Zoarces viviparus]|uniref:Uncharacterized protein n=1 Tax=Zoarces viviparus TaxID=48416 RepID=A0AAW1F0F7_ZOAVI
MKERCVARSGTALTCEMGCCVASWSPALIPAAALDGLSWDLLREQPLVTSLQHSSEETSFVSSGEAAGCCLAIRTLYTQHFKTEYPHIIESVCLSGPWQTT